MQQDSLQRAIWMTTPDFGKFEYEYNIRGLVTKVTEYGKNQTDEEKNEILYTYDLNNRGLDIDYENTENDISYVYYGTDASVPKYAKTSIQSITKNGFSIEYLYDQYSITEIKTIDSQSYITTYDYDVQNRIKELTYPDGDIVNYEYDDGGLIKRIFSSNRSYIDDIKYDEFRQKIYQEYGNGTKMCYTYDPDSRNLASYVVKDINNNDIINYEYNFDESKNLIQLNDKPNGTSKILVHNEYDTADRLTHSDGFYQGGVKTYYRDYEYYDDNRIKSKTSDDGTEYTYNYSDTSSHALTSISISNDSSGLTDIMFDYDDYGNMISKDTYASSTLIESVDYTFNLAKKLIGIDDGITELNFAYDNKGQRTKKVYEDELGVIKESIYVDEIYSIIDGRIDKHISDGKQTIATLVNNDFNNVKFYHSNYLGSTAALSDTNGNMYQMYFYSPYGETWIKENNPDNNDITRLFTGHEFDQESGLYYMNARYYDPKLGIFISPDPKMDGENHYAYANCNPFKYIDPTGEDVIICYMNFLNIGHTAIAIENPNGGWDFFSFGGAGTKNTNFKEHYSSKSQMLADLGKRFYTDFEIIKSTPEQDKAMKEYAKKNWEKLQKLDKWGANTWAVDNNCYMFVNRVLGAGGIFRQDGIPMSGLLANNDFMALYQPIMSMLGMGIAGMITSMILSAGNPTAMGQAVALQMIFFGATLLGFALVGQIAYLVFQSVLMANNSNKIICTELYRQGLMSDKIYQADQKFGHKLAKDYPLIMSGYHYLAKPLVKQMKKSLVFTKIVNVIATPWANEMAYQTGFRDKGDVIGKAIMGAGLVLCGTVGYLIEKGIDIRIILLLILLLMNLLLVLSITRSQRKNDILLLSNV